MYNSLDTPVSAQTPGVARGACNSSAAGLASLVTGEVPQELYARPVDGPPETAPNCEALISKAKASERELIRTLVIHDRESQTRLPHKDKTCNVSVINCSRGSKATYSCTECSLTTPVEIVIALTVGRKPLVSLPMKVGLICKVAPRSARTERYVCKRGSSGLTS